MHDRVFWVHSEVLHIRRANTTVGQIPTPVDRRPNNSGTHVKLPIVTGLVHSTRPCILGAFRGVAHKAGKHDRG